MFEDKEGEPMFRFFTVPRIVSIAILILAVFGLGYGFGVRKAPEPDPKVLAFKLPKDLKWSGSESSPSQMAVLYGDPSKEGLYIVLNKWHPHNMSRPHFHPNDRFFVVISGTWWMGTGEKFDPESTVPAPAGSYVIHYGGKVHYDGAKTEETIIQVWGMGPATSTPAEKR